MRGISYKGRINNINLETYFDDIIDIEDTTEEKEEEEELGDYNYFQYEEE